MKRILSNSWKKPFEGDTRHSQDSAISSQGMHNSQCMEFSQVSTQDLFGQNSGSQSEQSNQKMSMYEKWLSKKSLAKSCWTPVQNEGLGRSANKTTPSSVDGFSTNKMKSVGKDERDLLEMMLNSLHESKNEMKSLPHNLKEMLEKMGETFSDEVKSVISSFMEEIAKSHDKYFQVIEKNKSMEKELEKQLVSKECQISTLETKLRLFEEQDKKTKTDTNYYAKEFQEEMKSFHSVVLRKLGENNESLGCQKEAVNQYQAAFEQLKDDYASISKQVQSDVKQSEMRIMKEMKNLPKDLKNAVDIRCDLLAYIEGLSLEINQSVKAELQWFSKDIKDEFSKQHKKYHDQLLRKQFDVISNKMDGLVNDHKMIQQYIEAGIQNSFRHHFKDANESIKQIRDNSYSGSSQIKQIQQSVTRSQEQQSEYLQNIIIHQKQFSEQFKNFLKNDIHLKNRVESTRKQDHSQIPNSTFSDKLIKRNIVTTQESEVIERKYRAAAMNIHYPNLSQSNTSSNEIIQKADDEVSNISMPMINQNDIKAFCDTGGFKSPCLSFVKKKNSFQTKHHPMITDKSSLEYSQIHDKSLTHNPSFKIPTKTYSKCKPSPVVAVRPQRREDDDRLLKDKGFINKEAQTFNSQFKHAMNKNNSDGQQNPNLEADDNQENGYWLRKRNNQFYNSKNTYIRQTPQRSRNLREPLSSDHTKYNICRKRQWPEYQEVDGRKEHNSSVYDFKDDSDSILRQKLYRQMDYEERSSVSSPALTINLTWAETPSLIRRKKDYLQSRNCSKGESLLLDDMY